VFNGEGYFCSDMCEIKNYTPQVMRFENDVVSPKTKEKIPEIPINNEIIEIKEKLTQVEKDLEISKVKPKIEINQSI